MFERFTEKAIKVIMLAQEEARRLGHNFVGTEQILLGLIGEGTGVAYNFCPGLEPDGYVNNNSDVDDSIFCLSNIIDDCEVCDGGNADQDCAGVCFGTSQLDDCGVCDDENPDKDCAGF